MDPVLAGDSGIVLGRGDEVTFLQNPDGADVMLGYKGMERPVFHFGNERAESSRCNAPAPELAPNPVADQLPLLRDPAADIPSHLPVADDRANDVRGLAAKLDPMCPEGVVIPRGKRRHPHRLRVALMLEENRKIGVGDLAQNDRCWISHPESEAAERQPSKLPRKSLGSLARNRVKRRVRRRLVSGCELCERSEFTTVVTLTDGPFGILAKQTESDNTQ